MKTAVKIATFGFTQMIRVYYSATKMLSSLKEIIILILTVSEKNHPGTPPFPPPPLLTDPVKSQG